MWALYTLTGTWQERVRGHTRGALTANAFSVTLAVLVGSFVVLARFVRDSMLGSVLVYTTGVTSIARTASAAVDDGLWGQVQVRESVVSQDR
jgi:hypothetical protein